MPVLVMPTYPSNPDYSYRCVIERVTYGVHLYWLSRPGVWKFSLFDAARQPIRVGRPVLVGLPLLWRCRDPRRPPGDFFLVGPLDPPPTLDNLGTDFKLLYAGLADQARMAVAPSADAAVKIEEAP